MNKPKSALAGRGSRGWIIGVTTVLNVALGVLVGWWVFGPNPPGTDSVDAGFARDMSEHHAQAVDMSLIALQDSEATDIDLLAYDIATTQSTQIGTMQGWLQQWDLPSARPGPRMAWMPQTGTPSMDMDPTAEPGTPDFSAMPGMATPAELEQLEEAAGTDSEILLLQLMITHHIAGIDMAQAAVDTADTPEVTRLAQTMVDGQTSEIALMTGLLTIRDATPRDTP